MKSFTKLHLLSLIFTFAFAPAAYAVDGCSSTSFTIATSINLEVSPLAIAGGDFNGDGRKDLVVAPANLSREVIVVFGRGGSEGFGPPIHFPVGGDPRHIAVGDLNGDGKPDLVVTVDGFSDPLGGRFVFLFNDGTGKFGLPINVSVEGNPSQSVLSDVNNDGKLDIIAGIFNATDQGRVVVLLGNGFGFSLAPNSPFSTFSRNSAAVVPGDFNEDGKPDLAVPGRLVGVDIWLGDGTGVFSVGPSVVTSNSPRWLTVANFNADGHLDLLADDRVVLGTGTGNFSAPIVSSFAENTVAGLPVDVNNDTHVDVVSAGGRGITILLGDGTGNLIRGKSYISGQIIFGTSSTVIGDFNQDGKVDLAATQPDGIGILDGDGTGTFNDAFSYHTVAPSMHEMVRGDFNNDGKHDFAIVGPSFRGLQDPGGSAVEVVLGDGSGGFTRKSVTHFGTVLLTSVTTADFNGDGKLDLAVTKAVEENNIAILLNDGTGGFPTDGFSVPTIPVALPFIVIKAGDFNNDAKADLVGIVANLNSYAVLLGTGTGTFNNIGGGPLQSGFHFLEDLDIGDFDGDSKLDLAIVRSGVDVVHALRGDGTGHFSDYAIVPLTGSPVSVAVRDLNGDGKGDIAVSHSPIENFTRQGILTVLIGNGVDGFNPATNYTTDSPGMLGSGDFNSDNKPDLVVSSGAIIFGTNSNGITFLTNKGNGEFNAPVNVNTAFVSDLVLVADFNNDGKDDVAVSHTVANVGILLNTFTSARPCLSIDDVSVTETDTGTVNAVFTISLSEASTQTVRVNYFTTQTAGTFFGSDATKGVDFDHVADTLTFLPGETTKPINIPVKGDLLDEMDQFFNVILTTPINAAISDGRGLGTIVDNDASPAISISDATVVEGTGFGVQNFAIFTLTLNAPSENHVFADFSLTPGTASANIDYLDVTDFAGFQPGTVTTTIAIPINQDNEFEPDETFSINLSNPANGTIADGLGQATITNDDSQPIISISNSSRTEGAAGTSVNAQFNVTLSNPSSQTITVSFGTANGTATAGSDYVATSGTLTFNPGETSKSIPVPVTGDNIDETNETYLVNLSSPTNATIGITQGVGTIEDDDGPTLSIGSASVTEGHTAFVNAVFTVTLSAASPQDVLVNYSTTGGTATSNVDFQQVFSSTLFIPAGATSGTLNVRVFGDFNIEPDEQFTVTLQNPSNATLAVAQGTGTIVNDDSAGKLQFSSQTFMVTEDARNATITVNRVDGATSAVTVNFATSNGTAIAGSDYTATSGTLTFIQGETSKTVLIPIFNDLFPESGESVNLTLSNPTGGGTLGTPATATLIINTPPLLLGLDSSGPGAQQAAALDSLFGLRDPFPVIQVSDVLNPGPDRNTRVIVFVANLQLATGDVASIVKVNLLDSLGQSREVDAADVRQASVPDFTQITFRLPDNLPAGVVVIKVKSRDQESNAGTIRIK